MDGGDIIDTSILLTGATGLLGTQIAVRLIRNTDHCIVAFVRSGNREDAIRRLSRTWWNWPDLAGAIGGRVDVVAGDISEPRFGLEEAEYNGLIHRVGCIIHTAADLRLDGPLDDLRKTNVKGTRNIIELARAVHRDHGLVRLSHVSTAYVAGRRRGSIPEDSLTDECGFCNCYELSKYEGELLVQEVKKELPVSVFRPGMVVGDSLTGAINNFNVIYFPFRLYLTRRPFIIPARASLRFNFVPVDYVADAIVQLTLRPDAAGRTFHLTAPWEKLPTARELIQFLRSWARERLDMRLPPPFFLALPAIASRAFYQLRGMLRRRDRFTLGTLMAVVPYFSERRRFLRENADRLLGPYDLHWQDVMRKIMDFAVARSFHSRPEETVHERLLSRLKSKSLPVTYHDIANGVIITHRTESVRDEILAAAAAMRQMGIGKGDRVALVGPNCTRYLVIDVAIGILGAVSVPIYNTSSASEIRQILSTSRAKLLFVGNARILERLQEVGTDFPVVSFARAPECIAARAFITWAGFLAKGCGARVVDKAPVTFGDMATIRFTSGTSGRMKGAFFDYASLRWMAESVCTVMNSWRAMNLRLSYLSYLPMNHVVEGILTGYSPYYSTAAFDIFFLEDINDLPKALRKVRPHIFFSVPRFYEKVWQAFLKSRMTCIYIDSRGTRRRLLRRFLRRVVLKKAGLDRCGQLVVGSAVSGENLLRNFQELGIEIYNAYGLTEAPLVTMNRLGANRAGTVGEPVPETTLSIAPDGEIMITGPQVARGYLDGETCELLENHLLHTGDLGRITDEGSLVLCGRKKEILVTAYGKNVDPLKIESMLRCITGINEALVVGEGRPYCAAILWVGRDTPDESLLVSIERAIREVNDHLSHPEQVKRWAFLNGQPSVEKGEVTPSLKLKRGEVTARFSNIIEAIYSGLPAASDEVVRTGPVSREVEKR